MTAGFSGTFVLSWSQTVTDGVSGATTRDLRIGSSWMLAGVPIRLDGPADILKLGTCESAYDLRQRAARKVRRLLGSEAGQPRRSLPEADLVPDTDNSFVVTDGRARYIVTLIDVPGTDAPLVMFVGDYPPPRSEMWVVSLTLARPGPKARAPKGVICFTPGTRITTDTGPKPIEEINVGDRIATRDNGLQPVMWTGSRRLTGARLHVMPHLRPIRIRAGAMGEDRPDGDLLVSADHRLLVKGAEADILFNTPEVLVTARDMVNDHSIRVDSHLRDVTYVHLMTEAHEIIWANGIESESFHPAQMDLAMLGEEARATLHEVCPEARYAPYRYSEMARRLLAGHEVALLRHGMR